MSGLEQDSVYAPVLVAVVAGDCAVDELECCIAALPADITRVFVTGRAVSSDTAFTDARVLALAGTSAARGAALAAGCRAAVDAGAEIVICVDGAQQISAKQLAAMIARVADGHCDVAKQARAHGAGLTAGLALRVTLAQLGGAFAGKLSTGYWQLSDCASGCWVIHGQVLAAVLKAGFSRGVFCYADLLNRLYLLRAVVLETPGSRAAMGQQSSVRDFLPCMWGHARNFVRRVVAHYLVRDFQPLSPAWLLGPLLLFYGINFGLDTWRISLMTGLHATAGQVMNAALPTLLGLQLCLAVLALDRANVPHQPIGALLDE